MTTRYAPDLAPELEPKVVHWQPAHRTHTGSTGGYLSWTGVMVAVALGVLAASVLGAMAAGRSGGGRGRLRLVDGLGLDGLQLKRRPF